MGIGSSPEKFWKAFDFALAQKMSFSLAMLFCKKYNQLTVLDSPDLIPTRAHAGDAGADLRAAEDAILYPGEVRVIRTGVKLVIPYQYAGLVRGRSSLTKNGIIVLEGTVDCQYRGEIGVMVTSLKAGPALIKRGERIAQLVIVPVGLPSFMAVASLPGSERGENGFGSTGV